MTTLTLQLDNRTARWLDEKSAEAGTTPEEYVVNLLERVASLSPLQGLAERNAEQLRAMGYTSEEEVERMIEEGVQDVRRARDL